jgi:Cytidylate kinase-like family
VTLAALYGSRDSVIGPRVAERLGVPFLDREIPEAVAARSGLSTDAVAVEEFLAQASVSGGVARRSAASRDAYPGRRRKA